MKRSRKLLTSGIILTLIMAMAIMFSGCGSEPATLEDYINSDSEAQEMIDSMGSTSGMSIDVTDNTLTYTYAYDQTFDDATKELMSTELENAMSSMGSTFESLVDTLEEGSEISGITVRVVYTDAEGTELYSAEYN